MRILTLLLLAIHGEVWAQDADDGFVVEQRAGVAMRMWAFAGAEKKTPVVALTSHLPVVVRVDKAVEFRVRDLLPGWKVAEELQDEGVIRLILDPLAPGDRLAGFTVQYRFEKGEWMTAEFPPIMVHVDARATDDEPRDITGLESTSKSPDDFSRFQFFLVLAIAGGLGYFAYRWVMTPRSRLAPEDVTLRSLARLKALDLPAKNKTERHVAILSRIARRYIDRKYATASRRQTTAEFVAAAQTTAELQSHLPFLADFLQRCDVAKFAPPEAAPKISKQLETELQSWLLAREA